MSSGPGALSRLWFRWKSLKLPWRRQVLMGYDLAGNTFWEFKDALNANRLRRIVKYPRATHYADVKVSTQWHQWLRHTRDEPPTIQEQQYDLIRQSRVKQLAAEADARWASKPSFLDPPTKQQATPAIGVKDPGGYVQQTEPTQNEGVRSAVGSHEEVEASTSGEPKDEGRFKGAAKDRKPNPFNQPQQGAPGEGWQPQSWTPGAAARRG
ncbi:putative NADH ubiquinone oxidoreductase subunit NDUFA12 [Elsinoe australis]|uniref:NADH-ubiquinone oxidoreductase assembly factor N7BML n=1 Tax=Elsinoe australis TaxID=40998 RepID=A0A2P8AJR7_9PEZI|nr:NADH-ubiquinone oxidoreductase assembly factor N7BML [Elsinoe australis]TKX23525.1 putative NADH ubiquinone oxidoreductase subunit NDUFA12 [Elsinoe australis]